MLGVVYLIFNEGYAATRGDHWTRPALCHDALRLGRMLVALLPNEAEAHGLVALMELQASRLAARTGPDGEPLLLAEQDRRRWDAQLIRRGLAALDRAEERGVGPYTLQAAVAACHARARSVAETDWRRITALYSVLFHLTPSPVVALNRAVARGMADGPDVGLELIEELRDNPALTESAELAAARGTFLDQLGRRTDAHDAFVRAAALTDNADQRRLYLRQTPSA